MSEFLTVAKIGDIPEGEGRAFEYNDQMVAVFNDHGEYRAIDDMCPHMGASLASGHLEDCVVTCPWHGWSFDTRDGTWCENRRLKIDVYQVRVVGDEIQVAAVEKQDDPAASANDASSGQEKTTGTEPDSADSADSVDSGSVESADGDDE